MQDPASLRIGEVIKLVFGRLEISAHHGVRLIRMNENSFGAVIHPIKKIIPPMLVILVKLLVVGGEAFVQPQVRPIFARDQIAEPLVRQLMRDQALAVVQVFE